jgi:integrase
MALADPTAKNAKSKDKPYRLSDEKGLYLEVHPNGSKYWRHKYRFAGKQKRLAYGVYPEVTLKEARNARDDSRRLLREGVDPAKIRRTRKARQNWKAENTFQAVAEEWFKKQAGTWAESTRKKRRALRDNDLLPRLGKSPVSDLETIDLLACLQRVEDRGALETAHNARQMLGQVFRYAKQTRRVSENPALNLKGALKPKVTTHHAAITDPVEFGKLLRAIDSYEGTHVVRSLLKLCPLLFQRPGEMISMQWPEIDWKQSLWRLPADKMKTRQAQDAPLSTRALSILKYYVHFRINRHWRGTLVKRETFKPPHGSFREMPETGFVRAKQIHQFFGIGLSTWWLWVKEGRAPKGVRLGSRTTAWRAEHSRSLLDQLSQEN